MPSPAPGRPQPIRLEVLEANVFGAVTESESFPLVAEMGGSVAEAIGSILAGGQEAKMEWLDGKKG